MLRQAISRPRLAGSLPVGLLSLALLAGCGGGDAPPGGAEAETTLTRERVAHWFTQDQLETARQTLAPLVAGKDAEASDLLRAAAIEFGLSDVAAADAYLARVEALEPNSPALWFLRGQIARESGDFESAVTHLRRANELAPGDLPTRYVLGRVLDDLDQPEEAEALLRGVVEVGIENGGSWYVSALYGLERLLMLDDRMQEAEELRARRDELKRAGIAELDAGASRVGTFGRIAPPEPRGSRVPQPPSELTFEAVALGLESFQGVIELLATDLDGDGRVDLLARTGTGIVAAFQGRDGWREKVVYDRPVDHVRAFDLDNEPDAALELLAVAGTGLRAFRIDEYGEWAALDLALPELPGTPSDITPVDFDHEGDIDLLIVGDFGARLWRNDGAFRPNSDVKGAYVDVTDVAMLPTSRAFAWSTAEDFDGDNDVDLVMGGPEGVFLADSLRAGRFADVSSRFPSGAFPTEPVLADFDGDARPDVATGGAQAQLWIQNADLGFAAPKPLGALGERLVATDLDLDGSLDLVWDGSALLAAGLGVQTLATLRGAEGTTPGQVVLDADGDSKPDLVRIAAGGVQLLKATGERGNAMPVVVRGNKSNKRGLGSVVEVRSGAMYRRVYYRGEPIWVGCGGAETLDVLRITYPNGGVLSKLDVALSGDQLIDDPSAAFGEFDEPQNLGGSCPFLYTWNGETYEFVTDVLGITPLGLPMAPGMMVPPDHDEFVLVTGEQLVEQAGVYKLQITEELREVTYLDRLRLDVVDHPIESSIYPNELFKFPPFPEEHLHTVTAPSALVRATGSDGADWTAELATVDSDHARPFERELPQFQGIAKPWFLELEFDPEAIANAEQLRLVMTGWFYWSDASANMLTARTPGVDFIPPLFQVPDGEGGWRDAGPPIGFPAGKTKTMVIDVEGVLAAEDPRLRVFSTLQLYWDRIELATCSDDAEHRVNSLEPQSALLRPRGFSAPICREDLGHLEWFEWDTVTTSPRFDPHPGQYTRFGEVLPLLTEIDDRYVVLGSGDAMEVTFEASGLPPVPDGWRRDYLLFLDGWAKDGDPNTLEALEVEPLPFHGMSGYPYGEDESFPDDDAHREWRATWQTREGKPLIQPIAPGRR